MNYGLNLGGFSRVFFHIWFLTKYRRPILDNQVEQRLVAITQEIAQTKAYKVLEIGPNRDHMHILLALDNRQDLPSVVRTLKAVTAKKILEESPHLRAGNAFWAKRYGCREVKAGEVKVVQKYIRRQTRIPHT